MMALESLATWQSTFKSEVDGVFGDPVSGSLILGNWLAARTTGKFDLKGGTKPGPLAMTYTFNSAAFAAVIAGGGLTDDPAVAANLFATAWQAGVNAAVATTLVGFSTSTVPTPANTFGSVTTTLVDAPSVTAGFNKVLELENSDPVADPAESDVPIKLREAMLLLTITTTGLNSVTPTPGPLVDPLRATE